MKDQIQFETNGLTVLAVKPPHKASGYRLSGSDLYFDVNYGLGYVLINLPSDRFRAYCTSDTLTEDEAKPLVRFVGLPWNAYRDYNEVNKGSHWWSSAKDSAYSLLRSHGIDPADKWVLLVCE